MSMASSSSTGWEMMRDLRLVRNGSTGFTKLTLDADGIARIRLVGGCHLVDRPTTIGDLVVKAGFRGFDLTSVTTYTDRNVLVSRDASALTGSVSVDLGFPKNR